MQELGLTAKAVNSITKAEEDKNGMNIWKLVESKICVILLSPEMLASPEFLKLFKCRQYQLGFLFPRRWNWGLQMLGIFFVAPFARCGRFRSRSLGNRGQGE